jgi:hypothetical protein
VAIRADFTDQEWETLQKGVTGAGLLVSLSHGSFFDTFTGFALKVSLAQRETLEALRNAKATLESKAPDEVDSYRQFVIEIVRSVGETAGGGESAEGAAIEKVEPALR